MNDTDKDNGKTTRREPGILPDAWRAAVAAIIGDRVVAAVHLAGDVSSREHFRLRLHSGNAVILTSYPAELSADLPRQRNAYALLAPVLPLPRLLGTDTEARITLEEDAGDEPLAAALDHATAPRLLSAALALLAPLQARAAQLPGLNPSFDAERFATELAQTRDALGTALAGRRWDRQRRAAIDAAIEALAADLADHPQVACHRDYHVQNIHIAADGFKVIDYQDARLGPDTYDAASLLRERAAFAHLNARLEDELLSEHAARLGVSDPRAFRERYERVSLQRMLKACGTFAKAAAAGNRRYLPFLEATARPLQNVLARFPEYEALREIAP